MKPNIHLHLVVSDLARSAAFYESLFGAPVKVKDGYRKFLPSFAPAEPRTLRAARRGGRRGIVSHLGIQFETSEEVQAQLARVKSLGLPVREEVGVSCCHANQDKFWVRDPDGVEWEFYNDQLRHRGSAPLPARRRMLLDDDGDAPRRNQGVAPVAH